MAVVKPFFGYRYAAERVDLGRVLLPCRGGSGLDGLDDDAASRLIEDEPRHVVRLVRPPPGPGDGANARSRRAALLFSEWRRAGVLARDPLPAFYYLRRRIDDEEVAGFFALVGLDDVQAGEGEPEAALVDALFEVLAATGAAALPAVVAYGDERHRVGRCFEAEIEREPDLAFAVGGVDHELWVVDDESTTARVAALLGAQALRLVSGEAAWAAARRYALEAAAGPEGQDEGAGRYGLCFLVDERHLEAGAARGIPAGTVVAALRGGI